MYTTWSCIASLINLAQAIAYCPIEQSKVAGVWIVAPGDRAKWLDLLETGAYVALSLLVVLHVSWFIVENFLADRTCRSVEIIKGANVRLFIQMDPDPLCGCYLGLSSSL